MKFLSSVSVIFLVGVLSCIASAATQVYECKSWGSQGTTPDKFTIERGNAQAKKLTVSRKDRGAVSAVFERDEAKSTANLTVYAWTNTGNRLLFQNPANKQSYYVRYIEARSCLDDIKVTFVNPQYGDWERNFSCKQSR